MDHIVSISKICKSFGGIHARSDVDLDLRRGEILGLVGDNGAGKSTLLKILTGVYEPDAGLVYFDGKKVRIQSPHHSRGLGIEMVYQDLALCRNLDVVSNLFLGRELCFSFGRLIYFLRKKRMEQMAIETLRSLSIDIHNPWELTNNLSGGQQQAVAIAKAIRFSPKVVLMDEPTANLAVLEASKVLELMVKLRADGISIILVTHRLQDIFEVADRVFVLRGGMKVDCRPTAELDHEELVKLMFIGRTSNMDKSN